MLPVSRLWFGGSNPTLLISGQSVCFGCGSDVMLWGRESLFTNSTRVPAATFNCVVLTPADVIVMVEAALPPPVDGVDGDPPPQAMRGRRMETGNNLRTSGLLHAPPASRLAIER